MQEAILALDKNGAIGIGNELGFSLPHEMSWFKFYTHNKVLAAGTCTYHSVGALSGRKIIRLSRAGDAMTVNECMEACPDVCFIGGAQIYNEVLPRVQRVVVTYLNNSIKDGDKIVNPRLMDGFSRCTEVWSGPEYRICILDR